jgi:hypothetical protein
VSLLRASGAAAQHAQHAQQAKRLRARQLPALLRDAAAAAVYVPLELGNRRHLAPRSRMAVGPGRGSGRCGGGRSGSGNDGDGSAAWLPAHLRSPPAGSPLALYLSGSSAGRGSSAAVFTAYFRGGGGGGGQAGQARSHPRGA